MNGIPQHIKVGAVVVFGGRQCRVIGLSDGDKGRKYPRIVLQWETDGGAVEQVSFPVAAAAAMEAPTA